MNHVFLTGATGVVGSAVLPRLLKHPDTSVSLLIRASSNEHLTFRATEVLEFGGLPQNEIGQRVHLLIGDVNLERLGIDTAAYANLTNKCTHIVHCAGNVKLNQTIGAARESLVGATKNMIDLAKSSKNFCKFDAISTIGVAGCMQGTIPERRLTEPRRFHNTYEQAKSESEKLLWQEIDNGMSITIHRPSMIVGDSDSGRIFRYQVFYYLCDFLSGRKTGGVLPRFGNKTLDVIPIDYVANAVSYSVFNELPVDVLHLCSGREAVSLQALCENSRAIYQQNGIDCPKRIHVSKKILFGINSVLENLSFGKIRSFSQSVGHFLKYLYEDQLFETRRTDRALNLVKNGCDNSIGRLETLISPFLTFKNLES